MAVSEGDAIVMPYPTGGELYSIKGSLFDNTYVRDDLQSRVPTHEDILAEWSSVLQNNDGSVHRKTEVVFVKNAAGNHSHNASARKATDEHVIEVTIRGLPPRIKDQKLAGEGGRLDTQH